MGPHYQGLGLKKLAGHITLVHKSVSASALSPHVGKKQRKRIYPLLLLLLLMLLVLMMLDGQREKGGAGMGDMKNVRVNAIGSNMV